LSANDSKDAALSALLVAAGLDPTGLDLPMLATLKAETEAMIATGRQEPGFADADPAFNPPAKLPPIAGVADGTP
jgi:hypothetical protein